MNNRALIFCFSFYNYKYLIEHFRKHVLKNQAVTCKHVLAAWLASLDTKKLNTQEISSTLFRNLLKL